MTRNTSVASFFFFFLCIYISSAVIASTTTVHRSAGEGRLLAASNTCPARLFSFEDSCPSEESQEEWMSNSVYRAAARLLRSSSSAVHAIPASSEPFSLNRQQQQTRTMSSDSSSAANPQNSAEQQPQQQQQQQQQQEQQRPSLSLPAPDTDDATKLDVSGEGSSVKLDHLGPLVINQDGTMSRISNWDKMTEIEKRNTLRVLGKRNRERMEALKAAGIQPGEKPEGGESASA